jgi:hypothetical protein
VIFRRSYPELEELIARSQQMVPATFPGSEWFKQEKTWRLSTGATLRMRSLERAEDVAAYWGHQYSWAGWDELGAFPDDRPYKQLFACLRSAEPVQCMRVRASANPGGVGHSWIRSRFIDANPLGYQLIRDAETGMNRIFIPSKVSDNIVLMKRDPGYVDRLRGVGSPELVRAWLLGDWNAVIGAYFDCFGPQHIVRPFTVPRDWTRARAMDWGSARPFCALWFAVSDGSLSLPRGALYFYREWYGASAPNVGLRMTVEQVALGIREREIGDEAITYGVLDPACFAADGGPSIAERFAQCKVYFKPADNRRIGKLGAAAGWDLVRQRLIGEDEQPMIFFADTCVHTIRTLPLLQHDARRPEDAATDGEDHACDTVRYACASRPWVKAPAPIRESHVTMEVLWEQRARDQRRW